jgi:hypothetical protein
MTVLAEAMKRLLRDPGFRELVAKSGTVEDTEVTEIDENKKETIKDGIVIEWPDWIAEFLFNRN